MKNNTDKELKDKLQSLDFPFDPKAWEEMESKLEENRKPKGFLWWWFGGIAASLLVVAGLYGYHQSGIGMNKRLSSLSSGRPSTDNNNNNPSISNTENISDKPNTLNNVNNTNLQSTETLHSTDHVSGTNTAPINKGTHTNNVNPVNASSQKLNSVATNLAALSAHQITAKKSSEDKQRKFFDQQKGTSENRTEYPVNSGLSPIINNSSTEVLPSLAPESSTTESTTARTQLDGMTEIEANELTHVSDNDIMTKKEEGDVNLKKLNKKILTYSLGALANITGSKVGDKTVAGSAEPFAQAPSYMAGFTHDFTFLNRFAITNSFLFSHTSFTFSGSYASTITELAIPIGFKGYVVSKSKFRCYLGTGIINHIKLKETYTYQDIPNTFNNQTGYVPQGLTQSTVPNSYLGASELSINHIHRYYTSFYASAGAELIIHKHVVIFTEPLFYMSLQKVGLTNYHQYNLGVSGGIRYQF